MLKGGTPTGKDGTCDGDRERKKYPFHCCDHVLCCRWWPGGSSSRWERASRRCVNEFTNASRMRIPPPKARAPTPRHR